MAILCLALLWFSYDFFFSDTSVLAKDNRAPEKPKDDWENHTPAITKEDQKIIDNQTEKKRGKKPVPPKLIYKATQFVELGDAKDRQQNALGSIVQAKLITAIDTRDASQIIKATVTERSFLSLPYKTLVFGQAIMGPSKKVLLNFDHALLPSGEELDIKAQGMSSNGRTIGILGDYHGKMSTRAITTVGLTVLAGASEVLTEKQSFGGFQGNVAAKPNLRNAMYSGISKAAESEASRHAEDLNQEPEYVTVPSGTDFQIQLLEKIKGDTIE